MASIGQIIYNLEDYGTNDGLISTSKDKKSIISSEKDPEYKNNRINIFQELLSQEEYVKLGIQAPPGTRLQINGKNIIVGRTGVYELDEEIIVTSLKFLSPTSDSSIDLYNIIIDYIKRDRRKK